MGEALKVLEKAMLMYLLYPSSSVKPPLAPNTKKAPKLQVLDTGMLNYFSGFQKELFGTNNNDSVYQGKIAEHIVGQELLSCHTSPLYKLHCWSREKKQSNAEIDFLIQYENLIVKEFTLLNLPFYLAGSIPEYLEWMISKEKEDQRKS